MDLFEARAARRRRARAPLAERMRPRTLDELLGQQAVLDRSGPLGRLLAGTQLPSLILWGPPGSGKTSLARVLAGRHSATLERLSAVNAGVRDIREVLARARERAAMESRETLLFIDEIHRFNKSQQDALLPHVEDGTLKLIGATTENPAFEVNRALLSRCHLVTLRALTEEALLELLSRALSDEARGLGDRDLSAEPDALPLIASLSGGDARFALNILEACAEAAVEGRAIDAELVAAIAQRPAGYDKSGDEHFNGLSALHKSLRGSDPDAALYWIARMLAAGEDPMALCRRLIRFASEDVGLADPDALRRALAAQQAMAFLGRPEGELALAQVAVDLALAPKSNALYEAWQRAQRDLEEQGPQPVPLQLRNVKTGLDHEALAATRYLNPHRYRHGVVPQAHLPAEFHASSTQLPYYRPSPDGPEACQRARLDDIAAKLAEARELGHGRWLKGQERGSTNHEEIDR